MPSSATRHVLELLELLQTRPAWTGRELADRLGVDGRTVRRYVTTLQELGFPVVGERGHGGGYRLSAGYRLPPLMLDDEEVTVVVLGLLTASRLGLGEPDRADAALGKLRRVLPLRLRARVEAMEASLSFTTSGGAPPGASAATTLTLAGAVHRGERVRARYERADGETGTRELSPFGLVVHAGRWYLSAFDHGRDALRTFRVDRLGAPHVLGPGTAPPPGHDALEHVAAALREVPWRWAVEVWLDVEPDAVRDRLPATLAQLEAQDGGTRLRMRVDSLAWMASVLAGLGHRFRVAEPVELGTAVRDLAEHLLEDAGLTRRGP